MTQPTLFDDPASPWCQRWDRRAHSWRHTSEGGFDPAAGYDVAPLGAGDAKRFVTAHHYAGTMPAARLCWGLHDKDGLVGVAVLSVPMQAKVVTSVFPDLVAYEESLELGRFVLLDRAPANAESWFLARVFRAAVDHGVRGIVSFADPAPRIAADGTVRCPGHVGTIYQASNAVYCGRSTPRTLWVLPDGTVFSDRAASKIRAGDQGEAYAIAQLVAHGARPPRRHEDRARWLVEALATVSVRRRHSGTHRYAFTLGRTRRERSQVRIALPGHAYPKTVDAPLAA